MELTVLERLVLLSLLPKEGNFMTLKLVRRLREALSFDDLENKKLKFVQTGDRLEWNTNAKIMKNIDVGETMNQLIVKTLKDLDEKSKLTEDQFTLFEKFVENVPKD